MADLVYCLTNLLFFDIQLLYCYTNLNSSIICCLFSGDMYHSFGICISSLPSLFCRSLEDFLEIFVNLSAVVLPNKSPVASAVFSSFYCICCRYFSSIKKILAAFIGLIFTHVFSKRRKSKSFYIYSILKFNLISHFYNWQHYLITKVKFTLSSISNSCPFWSSSSN